MVTGSPLVSATQELNKYTQFYYNSEMVHVSDIESRKRKIDGEKNHVYITWIDVRAFLARIKKFIQPRKMKDPNMLGLWPPAIETMTTRSFPAASRGDRIDDLPVTSHAQSAHALIDGLIYIDAS
jgi:hypothetical protein